MEGPARAKGCLIAGSFHILLWPCTLLCSPLQGHSLSKWNPSAFLASLGHARPSAVAGPEAPHHCVFVPSLYPHLCDVLFYSFRSSLPALQTLSKHSENGWGRGLCLLDPINTWTNTYIHRYIHTHVCTHSAHARGHVPMCIHMYTRVHTHMCANPCTHMCTCTHIYVHMRAYTHTLKYQENTAQMLTVVFSGQQDYK